LIGRLKLVEEKMNHGDKEFVVRLNLTEDELVVPMSSCLKVAGSGNTDSTKVESSGDKRGARAWPWPWQEQWWSR
jgi:hypothetical protein